MSILCDTYFLKRCLRHVEDGVYIKNTSIKAFNETFFFLYKKLIDINSTTKRNEAMFMAA